MTASLRLFLISLLFVPPALTVVACASSSSPASIGESAAFQTESDGGGNASASDASNASDGLPDDPLVARARTEYAQRPVGRGLSTIVWQLDSELTVTSKDPDLTLSFPTPSDLNPRTSFYIEATKRPILAFTVDVGSMNLSVGTYPCSAVDARAQLIVSMTESAPMLRAQSQNPDCALTVTERVVEPSDIPSRTRTRTVGTIQGTVFDSTTDTAHTVRAGFVVIDSRFTP